jgi:hypothetical protein
MFKNDNYYLFIILFFLLIVCLFFYFYQIKHTVEGISQIREVDYKLVENCSIDTNKNLPSKGFYFNKDDFNVIYFSSNNDPTSNDIIDTFTKSTQVYNVDKCNDVLYSVSSTNEIKSYKIGNENMKFEFVDQKNNIFSLLIPFIQRMITESKLIFTIDSENKQLKLQVNKNNYLVTFDSFDLNFSIKNMEKYKVKEIKFNNKTVYDNNIINKNYVYGKLYDVNTPTNYIICICFDFYQ